MARGKNNFSEFVCDFMTRICIILIILKMASADRDKSSKLLNFLY